MRDAFFKCTTDALSNITSLFDMIWPLSAGLWNLRAAVHGIQSIYPGIKPKQLTDKFSVGSGIHGVNYQRAFCETTWETQKEELAWILLNSVIPIYEGWLQALKSTYFADMKDKDLQFAQKICAEVARLTATQSNVMKQSFYGTYSTKIHRSYSSIEALLCCYRVFKEMRNCYMHNGRRCNEKLMQAYVEYTPYANPTSLNVKEAPMIYEPDEGNLIQTDLRGVVGFSHIVLKIIVSLDAELLCAENAEREFVSRYKETHPTKRTLKPDKKAAMEQIKHYVRKCHFVTPADPAGMMNLLLNEGLVSR